MRVDKQMQLSDAQAVTASAASTDYYDAAVAGDAHDGNDLFLNIRVQTTATSGGAATLTIKVETDDETTFTSPTVLYTSDAIALASLTANRYLVQIPYPKGALRYLRVYYTVGTANLTAGKFDAFVSSGIDVKRAVA